MGWKHIGMLHGNVGERQLWYGNQTWGASSKLKYLYLFSHFHRPFRYKAIINLLIGLTKSRNYWNTVQSNGFFADRSGSKSKSPLPRSGLRDIVRQWNEITGIEQISKDHGPTDERRRWRIIWTVGEYLGLATFVSRKMVTWECGPIENYQA